MMKKIAFVWCFSYILTISNSAKILGVFPTPSISHQVVYRTLTKELLKRGHEVTVVTTDPAYPRVGKPENLTEIDIRDISYGFLRQMASNHKVTEDMGNSDEKLSSIFFCHLFETQLNSPELQELFFKRKPHFDLILIEGVVRPAIAISHIFNAPVILVSSLGSTNGLNYVIGAANHPLFYPTPFSRRTYNLTMFEKIKVLYDFFRDTFEDNKLQKNEHSMLQKYFGSDLPPLSTLYENVEMLFLNVHPLWMDNQPSPPSVVYMGGIHQEKTKVLPQDLQSYLDSSKHGVIYVSFGTNALSTMIPTEKIEIIANVLSELPYDVLWKWDQDELPVKAQNIKLSKWFPQADLLKHPNIKLFITQAGLQSTDEAITAGVPMVAIPMLGDQWYNAEKYVLHGIGKNIMLKTLNAENFQQAVETVLTDESYRKNIAKLREVMRDQPEPPVERAIWWIEHILRHGGGRHLRPPTANMSWVEYFAVDAVLVVFSISLLISTCIVIGLRIIYKLLRSYVLIKKIKRQ